MTRRGVVSARDVARMRHAMTDVPRGVPAYEWEVDDPEHERDNREAH